MHDLLHDIVLKLFESMLGFIINIYSKLYRSTYKYHLFAKK